MSDATAFERLGNVFASVTTGNLVVLGLSVARGDATALLQAGCALGGYALGVLAAAPSSRISDRGEQIPWPRATIRRLWAEGGLLVLFAVGWELTAQPGRALRIALLVVLAAAMGTQSVAIRRLGGISTTYLTGTLTGILEALRARRWTADQSRDVGILSAAFGGAALAIVVVTRARAVLPALQLVPFAVVLVAARPPGPAAPASSAADRLGGGA